MAEKRAKDGSRRGRPTRLTPAVIEAIALQMGTGLGVEKAARLCDQSPSRVFAWLAKGKASRRAGIFRDLWEAVEKARAKREQRWLANIMRASAAKSAGGDGQWTASAWLLERSNPDEWAAKLRLELNRAFDAALERLTKEFENEPGILLRAVAAIAGEQSQVARAAAPPRDAGADHRGGEAVQPAPAVAPTGRVPTA